MGGVARLLDLICLLADNELSLVDVLALSCPGWIWDWLYLQGIRVQGLADNTKGGLTRTPVEGEADSGRGDPGLQGACEAFAAGKAQRCVKHCCLYYRLPCLRRTDFAGERAI